MELLATFLLVTIVLLVLTNSIAMAPIFLELVGGQSTEQLRRTARTGTLAATIVMIVCLFFGQALLNLFGLTLGALQIAGGLIFLGMGMSIVFGNDPTHKPVTDSTGETGNAGVESVAVVPLAIPMISGPGAIVAMISLADRLTSLAVWVAAIAGMLVAMLVMFLALRSAPNLAAKLGPDGISIVTRISGMIVLAFAVQFIVGGLGTMLPGLLG